MGLEIPLFDLVCIGWWLEGTNWEGSDSGKGSNGWEAIEPSEVDSDGPKGADGGFGCGKVGLVMRFRQLDETLGE